MSEYRPLNEDVRWLAATLGQVIRRLEGEEVFDAVEKIRVACKARRAGDEGSLDFHEIQAMVDEWPLPTAAAVARAFALFFLLINTAEQVHRVRRRRTYDGDASVQSGSPRWAFDALKQQGVTADHVRQALGQLDIRPVLTAHPTEATRRTVLDLQSRLAAALLARETALRAARRRLDAQVEADVELLWLTAEVRRDRLSVLDEVSNVVWYLQDRLLDAIQNVHEDVERTFASVFEEPLNTSVRIRPGSWVAGDRDGNPFVTPEVTLTAARRNARAQTDHYRRKLEKLVERLSLSESVVRSPPELRARIDEYRKILPDVWAVNRRRDADEPVRLFVSFMEGRLDALVRRLTARVRNEPETDTAAAYSSVREFLEDLRIVERILTDAGAHVARRNVVAPLIEQVRTLGFAGYVMDVREDADVHTETLAEVARQNATLGAETRRLVQALRAPKTRGRWGEMQARRVFELAGMLDRVDFLAEAEVADDEGRRLRPDFVVHLPGERRLVVDAKTPLDAYLDLLETET
ncbi:MAG: phosphoenolpyruvate carboxylase, partial [Planctomycetota bacterium]